MPSIPTATWIYWRFFLTMQKEGIFAFFFGKFERLKRIVLHKKFLIHFCKKELIFLVKKDWDKILRTKSYFAEVDALINDIGSCIWLQ